MGKYGRGKRGSSLCRPLPWGRRDFSQNEGCYGHQMTENCLKSGQAPTILWRLQLCPCSKGHHHLRDNTYLLSASKDLQKCTLAIILVGHGPPVLAHLPCIDPLDCLGSRKHLWSGSHSMKYNTTTWEERCLATRTREKGYCYFPFIGGKTSNESAQVAPRPDEHCPLSSIWSSSESRTSSRISQPSAMEQRLHHKHALTLQHKRKHRHDVVFKTGFFRQPLTEL